MKQLIPLTNPNPAALFAPGGLDTLLALIAEDARSEIYDSSTKDGRSRIRSRAADISRCKTYLDDMGKQYVSELKALPKQVDAERKKARDTLDALREEIRAPLTAIENAERERVVKLDARLAALRTMCDRAEQLGSAPLAALRDSIQAIAIDDSWEEKKDLAAETKTLLLGRVTHLLTIALERDIAAAKLRELETELAARAEKDRERQAAAEIANAARKETEQRLAREQDAARRAQFAAEEAKARAEAETERARQRAAEAAQHERDQIAAEAAAKADAEAKRANDRAHAAEVHRNIVADLVSAGIAEGCAKSVVAAVARGLVSRLSIIY